MMAGELAGSASHQPPVRVAVIGGGIIGLSTALALAEAGFAVQVLERGEPGRAASWAGGGILSALPPTEIPPGLHSLIEQSLKLYPRLCSQLNDSTGIDPEYWACGADYRNAAGEVIRYPELAQVRNPRLLQALQAAALARGVSMHSGVAAHSVEAVQGRLRTVMTSAGRIDCDRAVICAGAWSRELGLDDIRPIKGQMLLLRGVPGLLDRILIDDQSYGIPRRDGLILIGSTLEDVGFDLQPTAEARHWLLGRASCLRPGLENLPVEGHWAGLRPRPAGDLPWIGSDPVIQGLYYNTGHHRLGITLAPASAKRLLRAISDI